MLISAEGPAPTSDVWRRYTHPALWPGWAPQIRRVVTDAEVVAPDVTGTVHGPLLLRIPFRILAVDPARAGGSRAWARVHAPTLLVAPYAPLARLALRRLVT